MSSQRQPLSDAIYSVQKTVSDKNVSADPLVFDGQRLIPSVTRVFSKQRDMYVFLQAYERGATTTQPLVAFVTFYRGDAKVLETAPLPVMDGLEARSKAVPLRFSVPLDGLETGPLRLPGDGARSGAAEGRVLARTGRARAVDTQKYRGTRSSGVTGDHLGDVGARQAFAEPITRRPTPLGMVLGRIWRCRASQTQRPPHTGCANPVSAFLRLSC